MELPSGIQLSNGSSKTRVLKLIKNMHGQNQAGRVWNQTLKKGLEEIGFTQSRVDECVFYKGVTIFVVYLDDIIFFGPKLKALEGAMQDLKNLGYNLELMGDVKDYLGINFEVFHDGRIKMSQAKLIDQILKDVGLSDNSNTKSIPSKLTILQRDLRGDPYKAQFHYRLFVGKLNYLEKGTRPDIAYMMHQCARFSEDPRQSHDDDVIWL
jgi:hypothetical protein